MLIQILIAIQLAYGHGGRTDSKGGHNGPGGYHFHNSGYSKQKSQTETYSYPEQNPDLELRKYCESVNQLVEIRECKELIKEQIIAYEIALKQPDSKDDHSLLRFEIAEYEDTIKYLNEKEAYKIELLTIANKQRELELQKEIEDEKEYQNYEKERAKRSLITLGIGIGVLMMIGFITGL